MSTSSLYDPDPSALLDQPPWEDAFLAQRDVALLIPVNYHTGPIASLRAACFAHLRYDDKAFIKCLSNLLAAGFRRFVVDVYWDPSRSVWGLCPVQASPEKSEREAGLLLPVKSIPSGLGGGSKKPLATGHVARAVDESIAKSQLLPNVNDVQARQVGSDSASTSVTVSSTTSLSNFVGTSSQITESSVAALSSTTTVASPVPTEGSEVFQSGKYSCTPALDLDLVADILDTYLDGTDITTDASMAFLVLNLHAAASAEEPDEPAEQPSSDRMPSQGSLSEILKRNLGQKIYTPKLLQEDRNNLNETWLDVQWDNIPARGYYNVTMGVDDRLVTPNGWPTEAFVEFKEFYRLIAGFGSIDPQMEKYDLTAERDSIFGKNEITSYHNTTFSSSGGVTTGCLLRPSDASFSTAPNSSFAVSLAPPLNLGRNPNTTAPIPAITNLTSCGISPFLNTTLSDQTADQNPAPYLAVSHSALWSWAPGEPTNATSDDSNRHACAAIFSSPPYPGRWRPVDCKIKRRVACHAFGQPYNWSLSSTAVDYFSGDSACPPGFDFTVPRTALENAHLLAAMRSQQSSSSSDSAEEVFLNFNSLDVTGCWTKNINATCPYTPPVDANKTRVVVVPTVAAVIVFVVAALTLFVKCASHRRETRRGKRRRGVGVWDYEGIPS